MGLEWLVADYQRVMEFYVRASAQGKEFGRECDESEVRNTDSSKR
jgi:hypothetical protein